MIQMNILSTTPFMRGHTVISTTPFMRGHMIISTTPFMRSHMIISTTPFLYRLSSVHWQVARLSSEASTGIKMWREVREGAATEEACSTGRVAGRVADEWLSLAVAVACGESPAVAAPGVSA
jgi:hypothetical protein